MKLGVSLLVLGAGATIGGGVGWATGDTPEEKRENAIKGVLIGLAVVVIAWIIYQLVRQFKNDTVNYKLQDVRTRVYEGICHQDRIVARMKEHIRDGKVFTSMVYDSPKPRHVALAIEKVRIQKYKPLYNVQHNCM